MSITKPTTKRTTIIIASAAAIFLCLCICLIAIILGVGYFNRNTAANTAQPTTTQNLPQPTVNSQAQTWLVMFYLDGDNNLEEDIYFDLNEMETIGSTDRVKMVVQIDRSADYYTGDGNWTTARRYFITKDNDLTAVHSKLIADIGEVDMGDSKTLVDFASWAVQSYPADHYVLIMSDHGQGWPGGFSDDAPKNLKKNWISLNELDGAMGQIVNKTGISKFELVGLDACLMSMLEVYNALAPYSHYAVASQETEPSLGFAYAAFLGDLIARPEMSGADLTKSIVQSYISKDLRILDDTARKRMLSDYGSADIGADALAKAWGADVTLAGVDLTALPILNDALNNYLSVLKTADQGKVAEARSFSQSFLNAIDDAQPSPYIDLNSFVNFVAKTGSPTLVDAGKQVKSALKNAVIAEMHGTQRPGARGITIYFPVSQIYWSENYGNTEYALIARRFADQTLWDDFLAFHYAGQDFGLGNPPKDARKPAPGASSVKIAPLTLSTNSVPSGGKVNIQTDITGSQIAYVYVVSMVKANCEGCYVAYSINYIMGDKSQEQDGVVYPVWNRSKDALHINLDFELQPYTICSSLPVSAENCAFALVNQDKYTPNKADLLVFVEGWYIYADTGKRVEATMYLYNHPDFEVRNIIGHFTDASGHSSVSDIIPKRGDHFMVVDTWWKLGTGGKPVTSYTEGQVITFNDQAVFWASAYPIPGEYRVGIMVQDMDGNLTFQFAPLTITKK